MASSRSLVLISVTAAVLATGCGRNRPGTWGVDAAVDRPAAQRCAADRDCLSGTCRDGVCCAGACDGVCSSCAAFFTGSDDGLCAPVRAGLDPHDGCTDDSGNDRCGNDGKCDGAGACRKGARGLSCAPPRCLDAHTFVAAAACDGRGMCEAGARSECGAHPCVATGCASPCALSTDCPAGTHCLSGSCRVKKSGGEPCGSPSECSSGSCAPDGVCCDEPCLGGCFACVRKSTGLTDGTCGPVIRGLDPKDQCPSDHPSSCGRDGTCDGAGDCHLYGTETACGQGSCAGATFTPAPTCTGAGLCAQQRVAVDCARNACTGEGCTVACLSDDDCGASSYCLLDRRTCAAQQPAGTICSGGRACASGSCVDGVCCQTACADRCYACLNLKTGGPSGLCLPVREGTDPDADCEVTEQSTCGSDGTCNGAGQCRPWVDLTICAPGRCDAGGHHLSARACHQGTCGQPSVEECGLAACDDSGGCKRVCSGSEDCLGTTYCDGNSHACAAQKVLGARCAANAQCLSGYCADGVCCNTHCSGACRSCLAHENGQAVDGTCGEVLDNTDPADECAIDTGPCGSDGWCAEGRCRLAPPSTVCVPPSCQNAPGDSRTAFTPAAFCDGQGGCPSATPSPCAGAVLCLSSEECRPPVCAVDQDCVAGAHCDSGQCTGI